MSGHLLLKTRLQTIGLSGRLSIGIQDLNELVYIPGVVFQLPLLHHQLLLVGGISLFFYLAFTPDGFKLHFRILILVVYQCILGTMTLVFLDQGLQLRI